MYLSSSSNEYLITKLLLIPFNDLLYLCRTDQRFSNVCNNDIFWERKTKLDYNNYLEYKRPNESWRSFYFRLVSPHQLTVKILNKYSGKYYTYCISVNSQTNLELLTIHLINTIQHYPLINEPYYILIFITPNFELTGYIIYNRLTTDYLESLVNDKQWYLKTQLILIVNTADISQVNPEILTEYINSIKPLLNDSSLEQVL